MLYAVSNLSVTKKNCNSRPYRHKVCESGVMKVCACSHAGQPLTQEGAGSGYVNSHVNLIDV